MTLADNRVTSVVKSGRLLSANRERLYLLHVAQGLGADAARSSGAARSRRTAGFSLRVALNSAGANAWIHIEFRPGPLVRFSS